MALQARVAELQLQRNVTQYMAIMTDRELTDIGPSRSNVSQVLSTFASNHARGRDYFLTEMSPPLIVVVDAISGSSTSPREGSLPIGDHDASARQ